MLPRRPGPASELLLVGGDWRYGQRDVERARLALDGSDDGLAYAKGIAVELVREHRERIGNIAHALIKQLIRIDQPLYGRGIARLDNGQFLAIMRDWVPG